ncbi:carbohydrate ABC transporter permease [Streptomyces sp.]|uniref:carbohydrate ABC transporter permease n=1 Tax=Streptomyces sp. TaxID=1931 RepID=UPI002F3F930C
MTMTRTPPVPSRSGTAPSQAAPSPDRRLRNRMRRREQRAGWLMAAPALILLGLFLLLPTVLGFLLSFTDARLVSPNAPRFIGLDNFSRALFDDSVLHRSTVNTLYFAAVVVPLHSALALVLALLVNTRMRGTTLLRTVYFLPVVTSIVAISVVWRFMYAEDGLVNSMLSTFSGSILQGSDWLAHSGTAMPAVMLMSIWQAVGFHMIIWLAGLQAIPEYLYEAATLDGAGTWQKFRHVTWPGLRPTLILVVVTETIGALGVFIQINVMTHGGPVDSTSTIIFQTFQQGVKQQDIGYASAISLLFFVLVLAISLGQGAWSRRKA